MMTVKVVVRDQGSAVFDVSDDEDVAWAAMQEVLAQENGVLVCKGPSGIQALVPARSVLVIERVRTAS